MSPSVDKGGSHSGQASVCGPLVDRDGPLQAAPANFSLTTGGGKGKSTCSLIFLKGFHWESLACWDFMLILFGFCCLKNQKLDQGFSSGIRFYFDFGIRF